MNDYRANSDVWPVSVAATLSARRNRGLRFRTLTTTRRSRGGFGDGCQGGAATGGKDGSPDTHDARPSGAEKRILALLHQCEKRSSACGWHDATDGAS